MSHPVGFFSYVRFNDESEEGRLTEFREKLEDEVSFLLGEKFELFQDSKGISLGQNWAKRLDAGLAESAVFIPILTPAYLKRDACRDELKKFLEREKELGRDDLVLPLIYAETPAVMDEARRTQDQDPLAVALHAHQYRDWSDLRFKPWDEGKLNRLSAIAKEIVKALERKQDRPQLGPSTALAIGYYSNFLGRLCNYLRTKQNELVDGVNYTSFEVQIVIPKTLERDMQSRAADYLKKNGFAGHTLTVPHGRGIMMAVAPAKNQPGKLLICDMPTIFAPLCDAIEMHLQKEHVGKSKEQEVIEARELKNFLAVLKAKVAEDNFSKKIVRFIDEETKQEF